MDVVLGVAVTGPVARLALVGQGASGADVIDQSVVDLADNPIERLTDTVVGTNRLLTDQNHRLTATRLCWTDHPKVDRLRRALEDSGVRNVAVLTESQAVTALMRAAGRPGAALVVDDETATLSLPGSAAGDADAPPTLLAREPIAAGPGDQATATFDTLMARLGDHPNAPGDIYLVGASADLDRVADHIREASTMRVEIPDDPTFALARGAAMAAVPRAVLSAGDATAMAPAVGLAGDATAIAPAAGLTGDETAFAPAAEEQQLAYSMADEGEPFGMDEFGDEYGEFDDAEAETGQLPLSRRSLLLGNAVIAFAVIGFASLAVAVAVAVRPTASQEPVVGHQNAAPGKFMPLLPTQQQAPVPPPPPDQPNAGFQGGVIPDSNGYIPPQLMSPGAGGTPPVAPVNPAPVAPGTPGFVPNPNPNVPLPVPIIIPFPGWRPQPPPYVPPYTPPTTPTTQTITPYTPPTTTYTPPTTTHTPPTTSYTPPTTTYTPPTTSKAPSTSTQPPSTKETTQAPQPTHTQTQTQQTVAPQPTRSQQPIPQQPHGGPHHGF